MKTLTDKEEQILGSLAQHSVLTLSEISVRTYLLPDEVADILKELSAEGLIQTLSLDEQAQTVEREACALTPQGHRALKG